ncbi:hypothetical protein BJ508DRAFT_329352 [Ascobolus immersus RN42]|uniref:Uncharacterized protein n=1 Tax=Ascobolus immersus RN42 TaxID=1160509 RepID=A0A3N4HZ80_ASCIM|nr:hypothetical protein BJ508DRAFT_329352 [Ascobolus immersus RN42]
MDPKFQGENWIKNRADLVVAAGHLKNASNHLEALKIQSAGEPDDYGKIEKDLWGSKNLESLLAIYKNEQEGDGKLRVDRFIAILDRAEAFEEEAYKVKPQGGRDQFAGYQRQIDPTTMKTSSKAAEETSLPPIFTAITATRASQGPATRTDSKTNPAPADSINSHTNTDPALVSNSEMDDGLSLEEREAKEMIAQAKRKFEEIQRRKKEEREAAARAAAKEAEEARLRGSQAKGPRRSGRAVGIANEILIKHGTFVSLLGRMMLEGEREMLAMFLDSWTKDLKANIGGTKGDTSVVPKIKQEPGLEAPGISDAVDLLGEDEADDDVVPRAPAKRRRVGGLVQGTRSSLSDTE